MENRDDYKAVFYAFHEILDNAYYDGVNSFAPDKTTCSEYSINRPAFQFSTKKEKEEKIFLIFVIETNLILTDEIIQSWYNYSSKCNFLYVIVPDEIKNNVESILSRIISSYSVYSFRFEWDSKNNRNVIINY